jgi:hypothetical protein
LTAGISFGIVGRLPLLVYGQTSSASSPSDNASGNGSMKKQTNGGAIDVTLQPSPEPIRHSGQTSLKVQFLTKGTEKVQPHIDYDVTIKDSSGKQVISATQLAGQAGKPLHTSERIVIIPYTFKAPEDYTVSVTVYGILFNPIKPESADFVVKVA